MFNFNRGSSRIVIAKYAISFFSVAVLGICQPCTGQFVDSEVPLGTINGSNSSFTLSSIPDPASSLIVTRNGLVLTSGTDFTLSGTTITFVNDAQPELGAVLRARYRTGCIGAPSHSLLGDFHSDTQGATVSRGSIVTGQGSSPARWSRLAIGPAGRCLVSDGTDANWGECLFSNFSNRSIPFSNSSGLLSEDNVGLNFDSSARRLGVGTASPSATLHVFDSRIATGLTGLSIQAGAGQGTNAITRWLANNGAEVGRMEPEGILVVQRLNSSTNATRAGLRDSGANVDPSNRLNGDFWFNTTQQARKSMEAGQTHPLPQIICSSSGGSTSSTSLTNLGSCTFPASFADSGDRIVVQFSATHTGSSSDFEIEMRMAGATLYTRTLPSSEQRLAFDGSAGLFGTGAAWQIQTYGASAGLDLKVSDFSINPTSSFTIQFRGRLLTSSGDTVAVRNYTVLRYPAQFNP